MIDMKGSLLKLLKRLLTALLIWFGLTMAFIVLNNGAGISQKLDWFPIAALMLPIFFAALYIVCSFYNDRLRGKSSRRKPTAKAASAEPSVGSAHFPPTGDPEIDAAMAIVDTMDGHDFEEFCAELLERCGYQNVHVTRSSGDQGVDIIAIKHGVRYAFQCKRYASKLGNKPVQEVHTGKQFYSCQVGVVITNSYFTRGAEDAARRVNVELWDRDTLIRKMGRQAPIG